jgi:hypothetical protein
VPPVRVSRKYMTPVPVGVAGLALFELAPPAVSRSLRKNGVVETTGVSTDEPYTSALPVAAISGVSRRPVRPWLLTKPAKSTPSSRAVITKSPVICV